MSDAMKMALKKHILKAKSGAMGHPAPEGSPAEEKSESPMQEKMEEGSDNAPELHDPASAQGPVGHPDPSGIGAPLSAHKPMGELGPEHVNLLQDMINHISHPGRGAMTMNEQAGPIMKEKMASIMSKHNKPV